MLSYTIKKGYVESKHITTWTEGGDGEYDHRRTCYRYSATIDGTTVTIHKSDFKRIKTGNKITLKISKNEEYSELIEMFAPEYIDHNSKLFEKTIDKEISSTEIDILTKKAFKLLYSNTRKLILHYILTIIGLLFITSNWFMTIFNRFGFIPYIVVFSIHFFVYIYRLTGLIDITKDIKQKRKTIKLSLIVDKIICFYGKEIHYEIITERESHF